MKLKILLASMLALTTFTACGDDAPAKKGPAKVSPKKAKSAKAAKKRKSK
jgi:hypothetical protein